MKKVLNIVPYPYLPYFSGGQKLIAHFNEYLGAKVELHVAGTADNNASLVKHYVFHPLLNRGRWRYINLFLCFKFIKLIRSYSIDTVIIEHPYMGWLIPLLRIFSSNVRIICHAHNVEAERFRTIGKSWWRILAIYEGWVLRRCDKILCITEADQNYIIDKMGILREKCQVVPYGINEKTSPPDKPVCKKEICNKHKLNPDLPLLFFNGLLDYKPNQEALDVILHHIQPILQSKGFVCNILIAGKKLPDRYHKLREYSNQRIYYVGFVEDINNYTKAADLLLNPVITGGGIKTKMIEALGMGTTVVSTVSGAAGVDIMIAGQKLRVVKDEDWLAFAENIMQATVSDYISTPPAFYEHFYWGNIINNIVEL